MWISLRVKNSWVLSFREGVPHFYEFFFYELYQVLTAKIGGEIPLCFQQREWNSNHFEICSEHSVLPLPKGGNYQSLTNLGKGKYPAPALSSLVASSKRGEKAERHLRRPQPGTQGH